MCRLIFRAAAVLLSLGAAGMAVAADGADDASVCAKAAGDNASDDDVITACDHMLSVNPKDASAYNDRGLAYARKGDHAIADYDQAIRLKPDFAQAFFSRGEFYRYNGDGR